MPPKSKPSATLLFDEGEAIAGKRTTVRDSSDRYASMETAPAVPPDTPAKKPAKVIKPVSTSK